MKYFHLLIAALISLGLLYSLSGIVYFKWAHHQAENPKADFLIINNQESNLTLVDFFNYRCRYCKNAQPTIKEALNLHKDVRHIIRLILVPVSSEAPQQQPAELEKLVIAAGMQGKFKEMHESFVEYPDDVIPEDIIKETAELYGIDYAKMVADSQGKKVQGYLEDNMDDMLGMNVQSIPSYIIGQKIYSVGDQIPDLKDFLTILTKEKQQ